MKNNKELTIRIKDIDTNRNIDIGVSLYYKICCRKLVSKYYFLYKNILLSNGTELEDLRQDILLMLWQIIKNNKKTNKISIDNMGGYLLKATKWRLNSILAKAITCYKHNISLSYYNVEHIASEVVEESLKKSEQILLLFNSQNDKAIYEIITTTCTEKEAKSVIAYYFNKQNITELSEVMNITPQRVSALINSALLKLNNYFEQFITEE